MTSIKTGRNIMKRNKSFSKTPFYLVATPIGNLSEISPRVVETLNSVDFIACEDSRNTRKLLSYLNISKPLLSLHEFNEESKSGEIINRLQNGQKGAYVSDAGYPLISDPGSRLVSALLDNDIFISVINGPSALLPALIGSGLSTSHFYYHGFLDLKAKDAELDYLKAKKETLIFYEAPHRIDKTLKFLLSFLGNRKIALVREITKLHEEYIYGTLEELLTLDFETIKGELVIVVEGNNQEATTDESMLLSKVDALVKEGYKTKEAVKIVSLLYSANKNNLYDLYIKNKE